MWVLQEQTEEAEIGTEPTAALGEVCPALTAFTASRLLLNFNP